MSKTYEEIEKMEVTREHLLATNEILARLSAPYDDDLRHELAQVIAYYVK